MKIADCGLSIDDWQSAGRSGFPRRQLPIGARELPRQHGTTNGQCRDRRRCQGAPYRSASPRPRKDAKQQTFSFEATRAAVQNGRVPFNASCTLGLAEYGLLSPGAPMKRCYLILLIAALRALLPTTALAQDVVEYYGVDAIGSVRVVFDAAGTVTSRMDYGPFGEQLAPSTIWAKSYAQLFRDGEVSQDYAEARRYEPRTGRLTSPDPVFARLSDPQMLNRYSYAKSNPLSFVDPSGLVMRCNSDGICKEDNTNPDPPDLPDRPKPGPDGCDDPLPSIVASENCGGEPPPPGGPPQNPTPPTTPPNNPSPPPPGPPPAPPPAPPSPPVANQPPLKSTLRACEARWGFSSLFEGRTRQAVQFVEVGSAVSLLADVRAATFKLAKPGALGTTNVYASGINRGLRAVGVRGATVSAVGGAASATLAVPAVLTFTYNTTIAAQCVLGVIR